MTGPLLICGLIVLVLLLAAFWPPSLFGTSEDDERMDRVDRDLTESERSYYRSSAGWRHR